MYIVLDITEEEFEALRDYGTTLSSNMSSPLKRGGEKVIHEWMERKAAKKEGGEVRAMKVHIVFSEAEDLEEILEKVQALEEKYKCECAVTVSAKKAPKKTD